MTSGRVAAILAAALVLALTAVPLGAVLWRAEWGSGWRAADWAALRFTLLQASLSALLSVGLAIPAARALARRRFPGRGALVVLMGAPFLLPVLVAVLGLIAVFGRGGALNAVLAGLGLPPVSIYGLHGVVLAHVFFNLPLAVRLILQGWEAVPAERFRLAGAIGAGPRAMFRLIEWPILRAVVPGALGVVFLVCLTSFAVALTLGGGPWATTVELAIYEAFRLEFDLARAARLALVQAALGLAAVGLGLRFGLPEAQSAGHGAPPRRWDRAPGWRAWTDAALLAALAAFLLTPMMVLAARGVPALAALPGSVWTGAGHSILVAAASAALCLALALPLALAGGRPGEALGLSTIALSPLVIGTGLFLIAFPLVDPAAIALPVTAAVNAAMALPFALRALIPAARRSEARHGRLATSLGMRGTARLRLVAWPDMRAEIGFAAGLAAALSMGDLGVVAFFADGSVATLPLQMYRLMGAYRMDEAMGAALLLLALSLGAFALLDRGIGHARHRRNG